MSENHKIVSMRFGNEINTDGISVSKLLAEIVRYSIVVTLIFAASLKSLSWAQDTIASTSIYDTNQFRTIIVGIEVAVATILAIRCGGKKMYFSLLSLLLIFFAVSLYKYINSEQSCGCFGEIVKVSPGITAIFDCVILIMAVSCHKNIQNTTSLLFPSYTILIVGILILMFGLPIAANDRRITGIINENVADFNPNEWIGRYPHILDSVNSKIDFRSGEKTVIFYRPNCGACDIAVPYYVKKSIADYENNPRHETVLIEVPPYSDKAPMKFQDYSLSTGSKIGRLKNIENGWGFKVPMVLVIKNGHLVRFVI